MPRQAALLASAGTKPKRSQHRVNAGLEGRSERPTVRGMGSPEPSARCVNYWMLSVMACCIVRAAASLSRFDSATIDARVVAAGPLFPAAPRP